MGTSRCPHNVISEILGPNPNIFQIFNVGPVRALRNIVDIGGLPPPDILNTYVEHMYSIMPPFAPPPELKRMGASGSPNMFNFGRPLKNPRMKILEIWGASDGPNIFNRGRPPKGGQK